MIKLKSQILKSYYGEIPHEYDLKFIHYTTDIGNNMYEEYKLLEDDLKNIKREVKDSFLIYFSNIFNLKNIIENTKIITKYKDDVYIRIRNQKEYNEYCKLEKNVYIIIELKDLKKITCYNNKIVLQIDKISELSISLLNELLKEYNIVKILVGQIAYITNEYKYLIDELQNMYKLDKVNQFELEKNNKITNDIYSICEYKSIYNRINKKINKYKNYNKVIALQKIFNEFATNIFYDYEGLQKTKIESQNLIGPLFNKKCVCEGYAKLLYQICSLLQIDSIIVLNAESKENGGHVWNQICINDIWYNADMTSASWAIHNEKNNNYFLVSDNLLNYKCSSPFKHICEESYKFEILNGIAKNKKC